MDPSSHAVQSGIGREAGGKRASAARSSIDVVFRDRSLSRVSLTWWLDIGKVQRPALELLVADSSLWTRENEREKGKGLRQKPARDFFFLLSLRSHRRRRVRGLTWRTVPVFLGVVFFLAAAFFLPPPKRSMEVAFFLVIILFIALRCVSVVDLRSLSLSARLPPTRHGSPNRAT